MKHLKLLARLIEVPLVFVGFLFLGIVCGAFGSFIVTFEILCRPGNVSLSKAIDRELQL